MLLEAAIANIILATAIVAIVPIFMLTLKSLQVSQDTLIATQLATELMEEVRSRRFGQNTPTQRPGVATATLTSMGIDAGESSSNKTTFNDVDDFQSWVENPPSDPLGNPMTQFAGWQRSVSITFYDSNLNVSGSNQSRKRVDVCVRHNSILRACLYWMAANY